MLHARVICRSTARPEMVGMDICGHGMVTTIMAKRHRKQRPDDFFSIDNGWFGITHLISKIHCHYFNIHGPLEVVFIQLTQDLLVEVLKIASYKEKRC